MDKRITDVIDYEWSNPIVTEARTESVVGFVNLGFTPINDEQKGYILSDIEQALLRGAWLLANDKKWDAQRSEVTASMFVSHFNAAYFGPIEAHLNDSFRRYRLTVPNDIKQLGVELDSDGVGKALLSKSPQSHVMLFYVRWLTDDVDTLTVHVTSVEHALERALTGRYTIQKGE